MTNYEEISENLNAQVSELEALQSVYPKELSIADHGVFADVNDFINCPNEMPPQRLEYSVEISLNGGTIELLVSLPTGYPKEKPEVYARSSALNRAQQLLLNEGLGAVVEGQEEGEPCIYMLITWIQDHGEEFLTASKTNQEKDQDAKEKNQKDGPVVFGRYWIYSHHIYSKFKRRDIANLAKDNNLTGFCLAGKPGIVCMEGAHKDCEYCWQKIKSMNWHRISVRLMEKEEKCRDVNSKRKFADFQEVSFPTSERHNDMGQLLKYLTEHESQYAFKELFGIEGKAVETPD